MSDFEMTRRQPGADGDGRTVLFSFLSRADVTPAGLRSRAEGHPLDVNGNVVVDPSRTTALAIEVDPNLAFEHWGEYWRKIHGVRFVHPDQSEDEATIARLLRYDQIHRMAAGPASADPMPYRPPLDTDGRLFDTVMGHVPPYRRPDWDGVAYLQFGNLDDLGTVLGAERVRRKILPEDRALFRDLAPLLAEQHVLIPSDARSDAIILVKTHGRRQGMDRATFQKRWLDDHAALVMLQPATRDLVVRYVQLHNIGPSAADAPFYHPATAGIDGVTLMAFGSMLDVENFLLSDDHAAIVVAENEIVQADASAFWTGVNFTVVNG